MDNPTITLKAANIPFAFLAVEGSWDPLLFLCGWVSALGTRSRNRSLGSRAVVFEGERAVPASQGDCAVHIYRAGALSPFELTPAPEQWRFSTPASEASVQPGDLVLKRIAPISASVVPVGLPALPVDGNFFVVRGLSEMEAWWIVFCLNHPACADYLVSKSGRGILSRISLAVLREWAAPRVPANFGPLARSLAELHAKRSFLTGQFAALEAEVGAFVSDLSDTAAYEESERHFAADSWSFYFPAALVDLSWLPAHVAATYRSEMLRRDNDWRAIRSYLLPEPPSRQRFSATDDPVPVLRLSDIRDIPVVPSSLPESVPTQVNRVFSDPLQPDDVLLSTLGSSPRVAFTPSRLQPPVHAVDHWERLRFRSHAGAYTLILQTTPILHQLQALATGSAQQFVRPDDLQRLFLPVIPDETLAQWDRSFRSLGNSWAQTSADWSAALAEGWRAFSREFPATPLASTPQ